MPDFNDPDDGALPSFVELNEIQLAPKAMARFREDLSKARLAKCVVAFAAQIPLSALE
jgi:hypothetical protein